MLVVSHGDFMWSTRLVLERWSDEQFLRYDKDPSMTIHNCSVVHYTRINPHTGVEESKIRWVRFAHPRCDPETGQWRMQVQDWKSFDRRYLTNEELLAQAEEQARILSR